MTIRDLQPKLIWEQFDDICQVPRPSKKEGKIIAWLIEFAKKHKALSLAGGFSDLGAALSEDDVKALAAMPTKNELIAQVVAQLLSPATDSISALSGGLSGIVSGLEAHAN